MHIVVVNSDKAVARRMRVVLSGAGHEAVTAETADEALNVISESSTNAVLLDIDLPDRDGCEFCQTLRDRQYLGPIIFVSRRRGTKDKLRAFEYGADDYLVEPFDPQELVARVEVVFRRCNWNGLQNSAISLKVEDAELLVSELSFRSSGRPAVLLTPTEMRILEYLMRNVGHTVSREMLIERTWGYDFFGDSNRVEVYIARLRKKIEPIPSEPRYLHTIRGLGYMFRAAKPQPNGSANGHESRDVIDAGSRESLPRFVPAFSQSMHNGAVSGR